MKRFNLILCLAAVLTALSAPTNSASSLRANRANHTGMTALVTEDDGLSRARELVGAINRYRREQGLDEIPYSPWLTYVARWHVYDLEKNNPDTGACNLHSWSSMGRSIEFTLKENVSWSSCCYTDDGARAQCMWDKPKEISKGAYKSSGFEIAHWRGGSGTTISRALEGWKGSPGHSNVILNRGKWADDKWRAIGAAISTHYAVVWFGEEADRSRP